MLPIARPESNFKTGRPTEFWLWRCRQRRCLLLVSPAKPQLPPSPWSAMPSIMRDSNSILARRKMDCGSSKLSPAQLDHSWPNNGHGPVQPVQLHRSVFDLTNVSSNRTADERALVGPAKKGIPDRGPRPPLTRTPFVNAVKPIEDLVPVLGRDPGHGRSVSDRLKCSRANSIAMPG